jgi:hypothetical protein
MSTRSFGQDINQLGASPYSRGSVESSEAFFHAIVEDVVTNETGGMVLKYQADGSNLGEILFRSIPQDRNLSINELQSAFPMNSAVMEFPLIGEQVMVYRTMGGLYYTSRVNTTNRVSDSISVPMSILASPPDSARINEEQSLKKLQISPPSPFAGAPDSFIRTVKSRHVRAAKGDVLVQGRYGNTIRLGSNLFKNPTSTNLSPNIILTAGQWANPVEVSTQKITLYSTYFENINHDRSSIWMVSDQEVPFIAATAASLAKNKCHLASSEMRTQKYTGAQIFINSDRIILNSKASEISLFSATEINLSSIKSITVDTESNIFLRANKNISIHSDKDVSLLGTNVTISATRDLSYNTNGNYSITGAKIFIGRYGDTTQPLVLGGTLSQWLQALMKVLTAPGSIQTFSGPAIFTPPSLATLKLLQQQLGTSSSPQMAVFNSRDNFTTEINPV